MDKTVCGETVSNPQEPETLLFWAKAGAKSDPRVVQEFPYFRCDREVVNANVKKIPNLKNDPALEPELVVEFDSRGQVIRQWPIPVNLKVDALCGKGIVIVLSPVPEPGVVAFFITDDGSIETRYIFPHPHYPKSQLPCPALEVFEDSADLQCFAYRDLQSGQRRLIAYRKPCNDA